MNPFYKRQLMPHFADTSSSSQATYEAAHLLANSIEKFKQIQKKDEQSLQLSEYRNAAQREAIAAFNANPTDIDSYTKDFRDRMRRIKVPLLQQGEYGAVVHSVESQYYWTIAANGEAALKEGLRYNAAAAAQNFFENGLRVMNHAFKEPLPELALGDSFESATAELLGTSADGSPLFSDHEVGEKFDEWNYQILSSRFAHDLSGALAINDLEKTVDPNFDYTVTLSTSNGKSLTFKKNELSQKFKGKFNQESLERVAQLLKTENEAAKLNFAQQLWHGEVAHFPGDKKEQSALELLAQVQLTSDPISRENVQLHMDNGVHYLERYGFLPTSYAAQISNYVNDGDAMTCIMGTTLLGGILEQFPNGAKSFDPMTLLRTQLINGQILGGVTGEDAVARTRKALDSSGVAQLNWLQKSLQEQTTAAGAVKFYGKDVTAETYGADGLARYRQMVDAYFILSGGNRDAAIKTAKAYITSQYAETYVGSDAKTFRDFVPFMGKNRRKFRNTPESVYGKNCSKIINRELKNLSGEIAAKSGILCDLEHIILVPTAETNRLIELGENPVWRLARKNDDGTTQFYEDATSCNPLTYSLSDGVREDIAIADFFQEATAFKNWPAVRAAKSAGAFLSEGLNGAMGTVSKSISSAYNAASRLIDAAGSGLLGEFLDSANEFLTAKNLQKKLHTITGTIRDAWGSTDERKRQLLSDLGYFSSAKTERKGDDDAIEQ